MAQKRSERPTTDSGRAAPAGSVGAGDVEGHVVETSDVSLKDVALAGTVIASFSDMPAAVARRRDMGMALLSSMVKSP